MLEKLFMERFRGLQRAHGIYSLKKKTQRADGKVEGKPATVYKPVTEQLWKDHLSGVSGLGIIPIDDESMCRWGCIDIDVYGGLDVKKIILSINESGLPLVACRTKSGGLHLFLFLKDRVSAAFLREKLSSFAAFLGFGGAEIFPKQSEVLAERGDIGQWLNMPYYNYEKTDRYAYSAIGDLLSAEQFLEYADKKALALPEFLAFTICGVGDMSDGPPCLQCLAKQGFGEGTRNESLFMLAVYLKRSRPDMWQIDLDEYNQRYMQPPLGSQEVAAIVKSVGRKDYNYTCEKQPMKSHCDLNLCRTRAYGVGLVQGLLSLTGLTKFNSTPPIWFLDVEGCGRLELKTEDLQSQAGFQRRCMESLNKMPPVLKPVAWQKLIQSLLDAVNIIDAPEDASPVGIFFNLLETFCIGRAYARLPEEILLGKPWTNGGYHYFRMRDLMDFLNRQRFFDLKLNQISALLKDRGGEREFLKLHGRGINMWKIKAFEKQTEPFETPPQEESKI